MTYGLRTFDSSGNIVLDITDTTIRLAQILAVTTPASGSTAVSVTSSATPSNSIAVTDLGTPATVSSTGVATVSASADQVARNTNLRIYLF